MVPGHNKHSLPAYRIKYLSVRIKKAYNFLIDVLENALPFLGGFLL